MRQLAAVRALALTVWCASTLTARAADDPCAAFTWDVHHERQLFAAAAQSVAAGKASATAPALTVDRLYQLELTPQSAVAFDSPPGGRRGGDRAWAGLATLTVATAGVYRIALDQGAWVDVLSGGAALPTQGFQGRPGCNAPHKIVEFQLPAATRVVLQVSGAAAAAVRLTVTRSPGPAS
jgi:hypothetical protein